RFLEKVAHFVVYLVARLLVHIAWGQSKGEDQNVH
ncbi:MAG: hypothetical protein ACI83I_002386, partial [Bacteroidia bacterium]